MNSFAVFGSEGIRTSGNITFNRKDKWHHPATDGVQSQNQSFVDGYAKYDRQLELHREYYLSSARLPEDSAEE
jgi:hypothetical protein